MLVCGTHKEEYTLFIYTLIVYDRVVITNDNFCHTLTAVL